MKKIEDILALIDDLPLEESARNNLKFLLHSQEIDEIRHTLYEEHPKFHDLEKIKLELTVRFGVIVAAAVGALATLVKLL